MMSLSIDDCEDDIDDNNDGLTMKPVIVNEKDEGAVMDQLASSPRKVKICIPMG